MDILDFLLTNWWIPCIIFAIIYFIWHVRYGFLIKANPTFTPIDLASVKNIDPEAFRLYQKELTDLGFKHDGDFSLSCWAGSVGEMWLPGIVSVFIDSTRTTIAYICRDPNSMRKEWLEFSTHFQGGREVNSSNSKKISTVEKPLPTVTTKHYPRCSTSDLLEFHKKNIREFSRFSKPEPVPGNIMEKKIDEIKKQYEYNREKGIFIKSKCGEYYKITLPVYLKSTAMGFGQLLSKIIPRIDKEKAYRTGFHDADARELFKRKKTIKLIFGLYFLFPVLAVIYKFFFMHPDEEGLLLILWYAVMMSLAFLAFIFLPPGKMVLFLELVYFIITGNSTYIILWTNNFTGYSTFLIFLLIGMIIIASGIRKKKVEKKKAIRIISIILLLMVILLFNAFRITGFIYSFRHLDSEAVQDICIYGYNKKWGESFYFSEVDPEVEIRTREGIRTFCSALQDTSPYQPGQAVLKGEYVVRLRKQDGSFILFTLGRENSTSYPVALIGSIKEKYQETGKIFGPGRNSGYQSKELLSFLMELKLKKWTVKKSKGDNRQEEHQNSTTF